MFVASGGTIVEFSPVIPSATPLSVLPSPAPFDLAGLAYDGTALYASSMAGLIFTLDEDTGAVLHIAPSSVGPLIALAAGSAHVPESGATLGLLIFGLLALTGIRLSMARA